MTEQHLHPMTTAEWSAAVDAADLVVGPAFAFRAITGEYDVAVHVATGDQLTEEARTELINELRTAVTETVTRVLCSRVVRDACSTQPEKAVR